LIRESWKIGNSLHDAERFQSQLYIKSCKWKIEALFEVIEPLLHKLNENKSRLGPDDV
jgi:hypothetical protein